MAKMDPAAVLHLVADLVGQVSASGEDEGRERELDRVRELHDRAVRDLLAARQERDVALKRRDAVMAERDQLREELARSQRMHEAIDKIVAERDEARELLREHAAQCLTLLAAIDRHAAKAISLDDLLEIAEGVRGLPSPDEEGEA